MENLEYTITNRFTRDRSGDGDAARCTHKYNGGGAEAACSMTVDIYVYSYLCLSSSVYDGRAPL